jgi:four helix bundle protein
MYLFYFQKLEIWQNSRSLVKDIYLLTKSFPKDEQYHMISQIRRAATSIPCNLAEGLSRMSGKDKARFTTMAFGSLMELLSLLITSLDLDYINQAQYMPLQNKIESIARQLNAYRKSQNPEN